MIEIIFAELKRFLNSPTPGVFVLKGKWGIGKTYLWNEVLKDFKTNTVDFRLEWYSYNSLFGVDSLSELKGEIFVNLRPLKIIPTGVTRSDPTPPTPQTFFTRLKGQSRNVKNVGIVVGKVAQLTKAFPFIQTFTGDAWKVGWMSFENALICIDDLERAGGNLDLKDVLGLVSYLKEQKNCKIILILNEDELEGRQEIYDRYREKLVDIEIEYTPELDTLVEKFFGQIVEEDRDVLKQNSKKLTIINLRTFLKIKANYEKIFERFPAIHGRIRTDVLSAIVLFTHLSYADDVRFPKIEHLLQMSDETFYGASLALYQHKNHSGRPIDQERVSEATRVKNLSEIYGWNSLNQLDLAVGRFIANGWLDEVDLGAAINATDDVYNDEFKKREINDLRDRFAHLLWGTFEDNRGELFEAIKKVLSAQLALGPAVSSLAQYYALLQRFDMNSDADRLLSLYDEMTHGKDATYFNIEDYRTTFDGPMKPEVAAYLDREYSARSKMDFNESLSRIDRPQAFLEAVDNHHGSIHVESGAIRLLHAFPTAELTFLIRKNIANRKLPTFLQALLARDFPRYANSEIDIERTELSKRTRVILDQIASSNPKAKIMLEIHQLLESESKNSSP